MGVSAKSAARRFLGPIGYTAGVRRWYRNVLRILMYHRFSGACELATQCEHLRKHYQPMSMTEAEEALRRGSALPAGAVVVTVDDGYRDFLVHAHPVFRSYSIPSLLYVTTDLPDHGAWLWTDQLNHYLRGSSSVDETRALKRRLKTMPDADRRAYLDSLPGFQIPAPPEYAPLNWDEIRQLAREGVEIGAHTRSHPILSQLPDRRSVEDEIAGSKARLEQEAGCDVRHFCYPNGQLRDVNDQVIDVVRESGFRTAVTTVIGINLKDADPFLLRRIPTDPGREPARFAHELAGFYRY